LSCACVSVSGVLFSVGVCVCVTGWSFYTGPGGLWCDRIPFLLHGSTLNPPVSSHPLPPPPVSMYVQGLVDSGAIGYPSCFTFVARAFASVDGICRALSPTYDFTGTRRLLPLDDCIPPRGTSPHQDSTGTVPSGTPPPAQPPPPPQTWVTQSHSAPTPLKRTMLTPEGGPRPRVSA